MTWYYMSFATPTQFLGACVVEADNPIAAAITAHALEINPGGQVALVEINNPPPEKYRYVLMDKNALRQMGRDIDGDDTLWSPDGKKV